MSYHMQTLHGMPHVTTPSADNIFQMCLKVVVKVVASESSCHFIFIVRGRKGIYKPLKTTECVVF